MKLSEKITALRMGQKLSQEDVAEKLEVSRQSVSKWETGQSVPELDKIVKLAGLFGVSVDELVRDGEAPRPAPPQDEAQQKVSYVGWRFTAVQTLGILLIAGGLLMGLCAVIAHSDAALLIGGALAVLGLPPLLAKKHPFLIDGWMVWAVGYPALAIGTYPILDRIISPLYGFRVLGWLPGLPEQAVGSANILAFLLMLYLAYLAVAVLTILLPIFTVRACLRRKAAPSS